MVFIAGSDATPLPAVEFNDFTDRLHNPLIGASRA